MMTASVKPNDLAEAIKAGAAGYVLKSAPTPQIIDAVCGALDGEASLNQAAVRAVELGLRPKGNE